MLPLHPPIQLSGTFGELRGGHFHAGIDFRTGRRVGKAILATESGYVSRIRVSPTGYGKAVYIDHPGGYTSVYAHLLRFTPELDRYIRQAQYAGKSYEVELYPDPGVFSFTKGDTIGWSGNTGSSGGPHLHFEIRQTDGQIPLNPLLLGLSVTDNTPPLINQLKLYPHGAGGHVNKSSVPLTFRTIRHGITYTPEKGDTIRACGDISFGIHTYDPFNNHQNKNGVYQIEYILDSVAFLTIVFDRIPFDQTRYVNSLSDYPEFITKKRRVQRSYVQPGNKLRIYEKNTNAGIISVTDGSFYQIEIRVSDANGNTSVLSFVIQGTGAEHIPPAESTPPQGFFCRYNTDNVIDTGNLRLTVPRGALYEDVTIKYDELPSKPGLLSGVFRIHNNMVPLHSFCDLSIGAEMSYPFPLHKILLVRLGDKGFEPSSGTWEGDTYRCRIRHFGDFGFAVDTVAPVIRTLFSNKAVLRAGDTINMMVTDDLSGIGKYEGTLNGNWTLLEYDQKKDILYYVADEERLNPGSNSFEVSVSDKQNNRSAIQREIIFAHEK